MANRMTDAGSKHVESFLSKRWVWVCVGIAAVLAVFIGWSADLSSEGIPEFTPASLVEDYRSNDLLTTFAYEDKRIAVTGVVLERGMDAATPINADRPFLLLGNDLFSDISAQTKCYFAADEAALLDTIPLGSETTIEGVLLGSSLIPLLSSCIIVSP